VGLGAVTRPVYGAGQTAGDVPANCSVTYENGKWTCEHRRTATANMVRFRQVTVSETVVWQNIGAAPSDHIAFGLGSKGFVAINRTASNASTTYITGMPDGSYCDITKYDFIPATGACVMPGTNTDAPSSGLVTVEGSGQILDKTLNSMEAFAIHLGARMDTNYGWLPNSYGLPWHVSDGPQLGSEWRTVDGVTHGVWSQPDGVVNVTVEGAGGYVTGWVDWNQDGDFLDSSEQIFANQFVEAGHTVQVPFTVPVPTTNKTFSARFRVYNTEQTLRGALALPSPTGGGGPGEVEDYQWLFAPLAVTLASFDAQAQSDHVRVAWETVSELNNAGFNLYRSDSADDLLTLLASVPSQAPGASQGAGYSYEDMEVESGQTYWYWLEDVDLSGATTLHGPVSVVYAAPTAVTLSAMQVGSAGAPALPVVLVLLALGAAMLLAGIHASRRTQAS
jgi:hypothetical protein